MDTLETLKHHPRFEQGSIILGGLVIFYNDSLALYNEYKDIFINKIYDIKPSNSKTKILDVGGYIGLSAMFFQTVFKEVQIKVFEPDPIIFNLLKKNLKTNNFNDIEIFNVGVGKNEGEIRFFPDGADGGNSFIQNTEKVIDIKLVKLSDFINEPIDLLKMNIEGMEGDVFEEIEEKLPLIKEIIFEYHAFYNLQQHLGKILTILDRNNFNYIVANVPCAPIPIPFKMEKNYKKFNLVYARRN